MKRPYCWHWEQNDHDVGYEVEHGSAQEYLTLIKTFAGRSESPRFRNRVALKHRYQGSNTTSG